MKRHFHLLGIGGTGMTALAGLLHASGQWVTGSDRRLYPPTTTLLERIGVTVHEGFDPAHLDPLPDLVVVGNAISRGNAELEEVLDRGLPYTSMARVLADRFLAGRHSVVVAGTHGKTTTTSMLAWTISQAGRDPGFLIGGAPVNFDLPFAVGGSGPFVIEGDEYDTAYFDKGPKFMHYRPDTALVGAIEFDHADIYRDLEQVVLAFRRFVNLIPRRGLLVYNADAEIPSQLAAAAPSRTTGYGFEAGAWRAVELHETPRGTACTVLCDGRRFMELDLSVSGLHNVQNALAAIAAAADLGLDADAIRAGLQSFRGVRRRLEPKGEVDGVLVLDDFAHHPTAIAATLSAVRAHYPGRRVVAVLEPRSWSLRRNVFQDRLEASFEDADEVLISAVYGAEALESEQRLDPARLAASLRRCGREADALAGPAAILERLTQTAAAGDVIVVMSNGGFDGLPERLAAALRERNSAANQVR